MGFWVKNKKHRIQPPLRPLRREPHAGPFCGSRGAFFFLLKTQESCCAAIKFAVAFASLSDPRAVFFCRRWTCRSSRSFAVGQAPRTARGGGAGPPVRLLSLTSFSAGDLVPRPCMSSSPRRMAAPPVAFVCYVIAFRLPSCPRPFLLDWLLSFQQVLLYPRSYGGTGPARTR